MLKFRPIPYKVSDCLESVLRLALVFGLVAMPQQQQHQNYRGLSRYPTTSLVVALHSQFQFPVGLEESR